MNAGLGVSRENERVFTASCLAVCLLHQTEIRSITFIYSENHYRLHLLTLTNHTNKFSFKHERVNQAKKDCYKLCTATPRIKRQSCRRADVSKSARSSTLFQVGLKDLEV